MFESTARAGVTTIEPLESRRLMSLTSPMVTQTNLVSDGVVAAHLTDANLVNPWGIAIGGAGVAWVGDNAKGVSTGYDPAGNEASFVINIPKPAGDANPAAATGVVANAHGFNVTANNTTGASAYVFVTEDGTISGWSPSVDFTHAVMAVDHSSQGAVYKGATIAGEGAQRHLYVTNFRAGTVEVYDESFHPVTPPGGFADPNIPAGFVPFNIQRIEGKLYVTYARQNAAKHDDVPGPGNGFVDVFGKGGVLKRRLASGGTLNSPWAVAVAPGTFGDFANRILVGNFGDGKISAFRRGGAFVGQVNGSDGQPLVIDGLWALTPGTASFGGTDKLFFSAGPNAESAGIFGTLTA